MKNVTATAITADGTIGSEPFLVLGVVIRSLSTPEQVNDDLCVMRVSLPAGTVIPLHSHPDPEIFYVLEGELDIFKADQDAGVWRTISAGQSFSIPGSTPHAVRNPSSREAACLIVSKTELYQFFRELAKPFNPGETVDRPTAQEMEQLFKTAEKRHYWLASPAENAAIGISLEPEPAPIDKGTAGRQAAQST